MKCLLALAFGCLASIGSARSFSLVTYNVENLFDADGVAVYDDYGPGTYTPAHLAVKVANIASVLARLEGGAGPDIVVLNEVEVDQTPKSTIRDLRAWLDKHSGRSIKELLKQEPLPPELAGVPATAWLMKAIEDADLKGYQVATSDERTGTYEDGRPMAIQNVVLSRFPITSVRSHKTPSARAIVEVTLDIDGHPLTVFANHWKSGASSPEFEAIRRENAATLRRRLDEIFAADSAADVILAGDFNSHYNQNRRYRDMGRTAINDVLGSQGNELALTGGRRDLYNLWFELPSDQRGSDIFKNEWGTLMNIIVSRGLYDQSGIQYEDNSFAVVKIPGLNSDVFGRPIRWSRGKTPSGFSDHYPLHARFRTIEDGAPSKWMALKKPSSTESGPGEPLPVNISPVDLFANAVQVNELPEGTNLRDGGFNGRVFLIDSRVTIGKSGRIHVRVLGEDYVLFTHNKALRSRLGARAREKGRLKFYGELGSFKNTWEFVLHGKEWLPE